MEGWTEDGLVEQVVVNGVKQQQQQSVGMLLLIKREDVTIDWLSFFL